MRSRKTIGLILALWTIFGAGFLYLFLLFASSSSADIGIPFSGYEEEAIAATTATPPSAAPPAFEAGAPAGPNRIIIPKLGVNATIQHVGLTSKGNMGTPVGKYKWQDVAWYKLGPKPGEKGNSVISGHLDNAVGFKAVFANLNALEVGNEIEIRDENGKALRFRVVKKARYPYEKAPLEEIFGASDKARLNLITCAGIWIQSKKSYSERLVVYTERIQ